MCRRTTHDFTSIILLRFQPVALPRGLNRLVKEQTQYMYLEVNQTQWPPRKFWLQNN